MSTGDTIRKVKMLENIPKEDMIEEQERKICRLIECPREFDISLSHS